MLVNNETGVRQPLESVVALVRERAPGALVHTDAVQAFGWLDVAALTAGVDLVSVSAHKFGGPKGVGVLVARDRAVAATHPARRPAGARAPGRHPERRRHRRDGGGGRGHRPRSRGSVPASRWALDAVGRRDPGGGSGVHEAVPRQDRIDAICNLGVEGVEAEELLMVLDELGVCASAGSACASGAIEPSHVLVAMGRTLEEAKRHLRLSLGHATTVSDIDAALFAFPEAVERLRG